MTFPIIPASTVSGSYQISRSLRFRSSATAYFNRTFGTPSNNTVWTLSTWIKRGKLGSSATGTFFGGSSGTNYAALFFNGNDVLGIISNSGSGVFTTTAVFRDPSAWYHVVFSSNGSTITVYVNNVSVGSYSGTITQINSAISMDIGASRSNGYYFDGYLAETYFIDGSAKIPTDFGAYDSNGIWQPAAYTGTYGNNGFYLNFSDNSGATATTIGKDSSGNSNNWTPSGISVATGTTYDSMIDSPTNYADGGNGRGNYAVLNPLQSGAYVSQTNGNLTNTGNTATNSALVLATIGNLTSGKWYWEYTQGTVQSETCGIVTTYTPGTSLLNGEGIGSYGIGARATGAVYGGTVGTITSWTNGDIIGLAVDCDNGAIYWSKNGTWLNSGVPTSGSSKTGAVGVWTPSSSINVTPAFGAYNGGFVSVTFGQRPFAYTPPSGFSALNTQNMNTPTIAAGNKYFDATTYTATGTTPQSITNSGSFQPDLVWTKTRSTTGGNLLIDAVRGASLYLVSNLTNAEATDANYLTSFNANGFSLGNTNYTSGTTMVGWQWKGGNGTVSNTSGSITSTVSANTSAGFSVVTYTGTGANATVGHGLGVAPSMIITKERSTSVGNWNTYHVSLGRSAYIALNTTSASGTASNYWGTSDPSSTVFGLGTFGNNTNTTTYVAYCFAPVAGYSAFGSYTGNGSTDGPMIFTGFRPRWILFKKTSATSNWSILDTSRDAYNVSAQDLLPNSSAAETTGGTTSGAYADILSNGFKCRGNGGDINDSGATYIYAAFAETPFKYSRAR